MYTPTRRDGGVPVVHLFQQDLSGLLIILDEWLCSSSLRILYYVEFYYYFEKEFMQFYICQLLQWRFNFATKPSFTFPMVTALATSHQA